MIIKVGHKYVNRQTGDTVVVWGLPYKKKIYKISFEYLNNKKKGEYDMMTKSEFQARFKEEEE